MPVEVDIWQIPGHARSRAVCEAMRQGIEKLGDKATLRSSLTYKRPEGDVGLFYGLAGRLAAALRDYPAAGRKVIYADLGYWKRKAPRDRWGGYHKLVFGGRHPTDYFQMVPHDCSRAVALELQMLPWAQGREIVLVAMGPKGSHAEGFGQVLDWEMAAVEELRRHTDRPIVYRPKPNWPHARPLPGLLYSAPSELVDRRFATAHAIVSHHSNANVEGLVAGVPSFTTAGVAAPLSLKDLAAIENPLYPSNDERWQWICDVAWTQFSVAEMAAGVPWRHFKDEGLIR